MYYKELLVVRRALVIYAIVLAVLSVVTIVSWAGDKTAFSSASWTLEAMAGTCGWVVCGFALVLGTGLGNERREAGRAAFIRPMPRERYACAVIGVDVAALIAAYFFTVLVNALAFIVATHHGVTMTLSLFNVVIMPLSGVLAFYGVTLALGVLFTRSTLVAILVLPVSLLLWGAVSTDWSAEPAFIPLNVINPVAYFAPAVSMMQDPHFRGIGPFWLLSSAMDTLILYGFFAAGVIVAIVAWSRAEIRT